MRSAETSTSTSWYAGSPQLSLTQLLGGAVYERLAAGYEHACAVLTDGTGSRWGWNGDGQLGRGSTTPSEATPGPIADGHAVASIGAGYLHRCGVTTDAEALCWGRGNSGQHGDGTTTSIVPSPVLAMDLDGSTP